MLKNYKLSFEIWGLLLFLIVMIPNFIWFAIPAPNDILRAESIPWILIGLFVAISCSLMSKKEK